MGPHSYPYFAQEKDYSCGPAVMRMILGRFGIQVAERALRKIMKTGFVFGTRHHQFENAARAYGLYARTNTQASLSDIATGLERGSAIVVNFIEPTASASHFALVVGLDEERIILNDPWHGEGIAMKRDEFLKRWESRNRLGKGNWYRSWMLEVSEKSLGT